MRFRPASFIIYMNNKEVYILWDFNGTIFDDADASRKATNCLLKQQGLPIIETLDDMKDGFCFPVKDYYKTLGFDYAKRRYEEIAVAWFEIYSMISKSSKLCPMVLDTVTRLKREGHSQAIISACEQSTLDLYVRQFGLIDLFDAVMGTNNVNAHSKLYLVQEWRRQNKNRSAVFVGDTPHDFEVATAINAMCILYAGGYVSRARLERCGCPVIDRYDEIWQYIN